MLSNIELNHLKTFLVVAEEMNFGRAAERLHIAQPPLSRQIKRLEESLGVQLFHRTKPQIQLTEAGRALVLEARRILKQVDLGVQVTQRASRGEIGQIILGFEGFSSADIVPLSIQAYKQQFPDVHIVAKEMSTGEQVQALLEQRIDLGFIVPRKVDESLMVETILREPLVLAVSETHPLASQEQVQLGQLQDEPFIMGLNTDQCGLYSAVIRVCHQAGFTPEVSQVTNETQLMLGFVAAGMGIALLPNSIRRFRRDGVVYRSVQPSTAEIVLAIAWRITNLCPTLEQFLQVVRNTANIIDV
ncbi:MAG: LysR family transcriptional regulator [Moorea sp. SIO3C2]|nr:LysR family transcriptional regulator [Moorena sp. SIO3C2]